MNMVIERICEAFEEAESITVYSEGKAERYVCGDATFEIILEGFEKMIEGSRQMPAFGVSLDGETRTAMQERLWVEFSFSGTHFCGDMPFEKLLVQVNEGYHGFNIARYNASCGYHGRCYFLDLVDKTMTEFYNLLINL